MELIDIKSIPPRYWDSVVNASPEGWAFSLHFWLTSMVKVWRLEEHSFAIQHNDQLISLMPLQYLRGAKWLSSGGWGHGGPVLLPGLGEKLSKRALTATYQQVLEVAHRLGAQKITISLSPLSLACLENRWGVNPLVMYGYEDMSTHSRIVDLSYDEEQLWLGLSENARRQIRKARNKGYEVRQTEWAEMVDTYYDTHVETYMRTGANPHPKKYFEVIAGEPEKGAVLWAGLAPGGEIVAFHNNARYGSTAMYHTGCSKSEHLHSGINYLLMWEAIIGARRDGCRWHEVGEVFPSAQQQKDAGLSHFKSMFGGEVHRIFRGRIILDRQEEPVDPEPQWQHMTKGELLQYWWGATCAIGGRIKDRMLRLGNR